MKPFNLEEFKAGCIAITRNGHEACYLGTLNADSQSPSIVASIAINSIGIDNGIEVAQQFDVNGRVFGTGLKHPADLLGMYEREITDTERLEFMAKHSYRISRDTDHSAVFSSYNDRMSKFYPTFREAIDQLILESEV